MGTNLHHLILKFFKERMESHDKVSHFYPIQESENILYRVERTDNLPDLTIHLSDAYRYNRYDYYSKPADLEAGDFILIARPEGSWDDESENAAARDRIGIGQIGKLLGALNRKEVWKYVLPEKKTRI